MDRVVDAFLAIVGRGGGSLVVTIAFLSPLGLIAAMRTWRALQRRRTFRDFAAARHLEFVGTVASDARAPYTRIDRVRRAVLLSNVIEGQWDGLPVRVFDMSKGRRMGQTTVILLTVEDILRRGAEAERAIAAGPQALIETNLDVLCVSPKRPLDAAELATWLSFAATVGKAMERDVKAEARSAASPGAPSPRRGMFGTIDPD